MNNETRQGPEEGRISYRQALAMVIIMGLATTDILVPSVIASLSGRDAWITVIIATAWAVIIVGLAYYLARVMGEQNIIQYARSTIGKPAGWLVGLFYLTFLITQSAMVMRNFRTIMLTTFYERTPDIVFEIFVLLVIVYAVFNGLELISRLNEILLPLGVFILFLVGALAIRDVEISQFMPVLENGPGPVLSGTLRLVVYLSQGALVFLLLFPYIKEPESGGLAGVSLAVSSLGPMMLVGVMAIGMFGVQETSNTRFVALELVRNINIAGFFQNLDALMMAIWYGGIVAKLAILVYMTCLSMVQFFGLTNYRPLLLPLAVFIVTYSKIAFIGPNDMVHYITMVEPGWNLTALLFVPLILLGVTFIKKGKKYKNA